MMTGRRSATQRFLPGVYVPPGGKVDEKDFVAKVGLLLAS